MVTLLSALFLTVVCVMAAAYVATLIVYERDQHTLDAMFVSPLRITEYLNSKIVSLTIPVLVEATTLVLVSLGTLEMNWLLLFVGTALLGGRDDHVRHDPDRQVCHDHGFPELQPWRKPSAPENRGFLRVILDGDRFQRTRPGDLPGRWTCAFGTVEV